MSVVETSAWPQLTSVAPTDSGQASAAVAETSHSTGQRSVEVAGGGAV